MMKRLSGQDSSVLFLHPSEKVVLAFSVVRLWSQSLFSPYNSSSRHRQRQPFQQMQPLPFKAKRQAVEERCMEAVRTESRGEESMQFHPPWRSLAGPSSQYHTSRRPYSESPNEHSCPHSAWQWSPPLPLSRLTMRNIAPIKPQRQ